MQPDRPGAAGMPAAPLNPALRSTLRFTLRFTLYSRSYCHLCDDMLDALRNLLNQQQIESQMVDIAVIDVDADPALVARFDELVPVLFGDPDAPELCHYFLDAAAVERYVAAASVSN